jgi:hypothetical protein
MATLAELLRQGADTVVNMPTEARRFMTNPQAFTQALTGKNLLPKETGFSAGALGVPANSQNIEYQQGFQQGEPYELPIALASMGAPLVVPAAKALAPKAAQMAENYMVKQGFMPSVVPPTSRKEIIAQELEKVQPKVDYRGSHTPPNYKKYGAPLHDLTQIMPKDIYGADAKRLYGIGDSIIDSEWRIAAIKAKGKPDAEIEVFRAVPKGVKDINSGDWVTTSKKYATNHGDNTLGGEYEIVSKKVKANTLSSEGYPYEFGYHE